MKVLKIIAAFLLFGMQTTIAMEADGSEEQWRFIYVAALEQASATEESDHWRPTIYRIDVISGTLADKKEIAAQGAPRFCFSGTDNTIRVVYSEGIAANGTFVSNETTIEKTVDRESLKVLETRIDGPYEENGQFENSIKSRRSLVDFNHKAFKGREGNVILGVDEQGSRLFVLQGYLQSEQALRLTVFQKDSLEQKETISLENHPKNLIGFDGLLNSCLVQGRFLVCLFSGYSPLGIFDRGHVMIVDLVEKKTTFVPIGSNPAAGIAH
jgi:hypothetical protein